MSRDPFLFPLKNLDDALTLVTAVQWLAEVASVTLRPPPPVPTTCCGRGCSGCVWDGYFSALCYWRDQAADKLGRERVSGGAA